MATARIYETKAEMPRKLELGTVTERIQIVAPASWVERIDEWRRKQRRIPSKSEAIRMLVDLALEAETTRERAAERKGKAK